MNSASFVHLYAVCSRIDSGLDRLDGKSFHVKYLYSDAFGLYSTESGPQPIVEGKRPERKFFKINL